MKVPYPPICVAVIGMPRSGSTIVTSLLNSFNGAAMFGEPHRSYGKPSPTKFATRHGDLVLRPKEDVLTQITRFALERNLDLFGFKEVFDSSMTIDPLNLVESYGDRVDLVFVTIRDPRRNYSSLVQLGHAKSLGLTPEKFVEEYKRFVIELALWKKYVPVILEKFRTGPLEQIRRVTGWEVPGQYKMKQYSGGGDPHAMVATLVNRNDYRPRYIGPELDEADEYYNRALRIAP